MILHRRWVHARAGRAASCGLARRLLAIVFAISVLPGFDADAQEIGAPIPGYVHNVWTTRQGLPQNVVRALLQTRDGYLWLGGGSGLVRFDGLTFTVFDVLRTPALGTNWISALHEDADGTLWIGTDNGVTRYRDGVFTHETVGDDGVNGSRGLVGAVASNSRGQLIVAIGDRLFQRDGTSWRELQLDSPRPITALFVDRQDTLWIGSSAGVVEWREGMRRTFSTQGELGGAAVTALLGDRDGRLWIATTRGLASMDPKSGSITREPAPLSDAPVLQLLEDRAGQLWLGGRDTLYTRTPDGRVSTLRFTQPGADEPVSALTKGRDGQIWFGLGGGRGGLHALSPRRVSMLTRNDGLPCDNVVPVTEGADGSVLAGTLCSGASRLVSIQNDRIKPIAASGIEVLDRGVASILALPDGSAWIGTFDDGLFLFKDGRFRRRAEPGTSGVGSGTREGRAIQALYRDAHGVLWIGTTRGLVRYDAAVERWTTWDKHDGLIGNDVRSIVAGPGDALWIGTGAGISFYKAGQFKNYAASEGVPPGPVRALYLDASGALWAGAYGGGLGRFKDGRWTRYGVQDGLLEGAVHRILEDDRGYLWLTGDRGIRRIHRQELNEIADGKPAHLSVMTFDEHEGLLNAECNGMGQPAGWKMRDGSLWFPTQGGIVRIDPRTIDVGSGSAPPRPVIEAMTSNGVPLTLASSLTLPAGSSDLLVSFTAPAFVRPDQVRFKYRLQGHDTDWVDAGSHRLAKYTNLPPGQYRFEVIARGSSGEWSEQSAAVSLDFQPRFYQRPFFQGLIWIAAAGAALALFRYRVTRLKTRAKALESVVAQRTAELESQRTDLSTANEQLRTAKTDLEDSHTNLLAILEQLRIGVLIVDTEQRVRYASKATCRLLAAGDADLHGRTLREVLPVQEDSLAAIQRALVSREKSPRMTMELTAADRPRYWTEVEVRPDPRDDQQRIIYLYDVTETYDLKRAIQSEPEQAETGLVGESSPMRTIHRQILTLAAVDATVLIEGETGTGKEIVARAIHNESRRKDRPFVAINCAGLTESLLASQLFGHRRGAFTGAVADHIGLFESAQGGTLLLDEIGDMPMSVQMHLLRVLQEREILRLGDTKPRRIDVRVLVATHRSLEEEVNQGRFREDLLYRIRVMRVSLPPLRQRVADIPFLATVFMREFCATHGKQLSGVDREAMERLTVQRWPGNVRELRSVIEGAVIRANGPTIHLADLGLEPEHSDTALSRGQSLDLERRRLIDTLARTGGNRVVAARLLGISRATLYRRLAALEAEEAEKATDATEGVSATAPVAPAAGSGKSN